MANDSAKLVAGKTATSGTNPLTIVLGLALVASVAGNVWQWTREPAASPQSEETQRAQAKAQPVVAAGGSSLPAFQGASSTEAPELKKPSPAEDRLARRSRWRGNIMSALERMEGESDEQYKARIMLFSRPMLDRARERADEMRRLAEEKVGVTPEQHEAINREVDTVMKDVLAAANTAVEDGRLNLSEFNSANMLELAGEFGGFVREAETRIGAVLGKEKLEQLRSSGFDWAEYMASNAPWESLNFAAMK